MVGQPTFNFQVPGSAGKAECLVKYKAGKAADVQLESNIKDFVIKYESNVQGTALIVNINININLGA